MATVVITFFVIAQFYAFKMEDDLTEKRRARISSQREKRWSMNSQRLEEIVAELMRPIGDLRHSFDTDLSALLEEYLTEAGLHALDADEDGSVSPPMSTVPNFAELALLLQQSASIYGRKVDFLYQHVLAVSDSLHNSTIEITKTSNNEEEPQTPSRSKRKRKASTAGAFAEISLEPCAAARRGPEAARPPPTLPRIYIELEPRAPDGEPLRDYAGEPIGVLADFHVAWRLRAGLLVDELEGDAGTALRPIPLVELQAAIEAAAPPSPPPLLLRDDSPPRCSTPLDLEPSEAMPPPAPPAPPVRNDRKRKSDVKIENIIEGSIKLQISKELRKMLSKRQEFAGAAPWAERVVAARAQAVLRLRRSLRAEPAAAFRGFEFSSLDVSGFGGWSAGEAGAAAAAAAGASAGRRRDDSDDDGFFEQSSLGDSDASRHDEPRTPPTLDTEAMEWAAWRARVATRAAAAEAAAPLDVRALARAVLRQLPADGAPAPAARVLHAAARDDKDVSRLFLATLFLANAGNVEIERGPPLSLNSFSLRLRSADERLYAGAVAAEPPPR